MILLVRLFPVYRVRKEVVVTAVVLLHAAVVEGVLDVAAVVLEIVLPIVVNRLEIAMEQLVQFGVGRIYLVRIVREVVEAIALPIVPARAAAIVLEIVVAHALGDVGDVLVTVPIVLVPPIQV